MRKFSRRTYRQAVVRAFLNALDGESTIWLPLPDGRLEMLGQAGVKSSDDVAEDAYCMLLEVERGNRG